QIVDLIRLDIERKRHVVTDEIEAVVIDHSIDVAARTSEIVIDADDIGAVLEQALAKMRAKKSGAPSHNHAGFEMHIQQPLERDQVPITGYGFSLSKTDKPPDQMMASHRLRTIAGWAADGPLINGHLRGWARVGPPRCNQRGRGRDRPCSYRRHPD